jgi:hypothetical protein
MAFLANGVSDAKTKKRYSHTYAAGELAIETVEPATTGHVEELPREFSLWSLGSLLVCLMATWEALSSVVAQALISGGAPCLFYN